MSQKNEEKKAGSLRLEPLKGRFFDIKPPKKGQGSPLKGKSRDFFNFALIAFVFFLVLTVGNAIAAGRELVFESEELAYEGYENLKLGMGSLLDQDTETASAYFVQAQESFEELQDVTAHVTAQANQLSGEGLYLDTAGKLLEGAMEAAKIGRELSGLMADFEVLPKAFLSSSESDTDLITILSEKKQVLDTILVSAASLQRKITTLNTQILPESLERQLRQAQRQVGEFLAILLDFDRNYDVVLRLLGDRTPHRYLVLLQNNYELRATGGFIGSYLIVDVNDGRIASMQAKDVYETDGQLAEFVKAPRGIDQVASQLYMRDANYSPDFPTSVREIMWFLEHSKGPSVDTVVAIDQTVVESLLALTGPLLLEGFPFQVSADNFNDIISFYTEAKLLETATPKQLLFDLIPVLQEHLVKVSDMTALSELSGKLLEEGHIQAYSADPAVQELITRVGADGTMVRPAEETDYLQVVTTSIGGNKSDRYMETELYHHTHVKRGGELVNELTVTRRHTFGQEEEDKIGSMIDQYGTGKLNEESLFFILGQGPNVDYMRVYVPLGSQLQNVTGVDLAAVEVSQDLGYTVFAFTNGPIRAGETKEVTIRYQLPFELSLWPTDNYRFVAEKQAGARKVTLTKELTTANRILVSQSYPTPAEAFRLNPVFDWVFDKNRIFMASVRRAMSN